MRMIHKRAFILVARVVFAYGLGAEPKPLSPEDVVNAPLTGDARLKSANWDWLSAQARARKPTTESCHRCRRLPAPRDY
jgi:hypothetical protein